MFAVPSSVFSLSYLLGRVVLSIRRRVKLKVVLIRLCPRRGEGRRDPKPAKEREMVRKKKLSLFALVSSPPRSVFSVIGQDPTSSDLLISIQALMSSSRMIRKPQGTKEKENREAQANPDGSCFLLRSFGFFSPLLPLLKSCVPHTSLSYAIGDRRGTLTWSLFRAIIKTSKHEASLA